MPRASRSRAAAEAAAAVVGPSASRRSRRAPTPQESSEEDRGETPLQDASQLEDEGDGVLENDEEEVVEEDQRSRASNSDADSAPATPSPGRPSALRRGSRRGRKPRGGVRRDSQADQDSRDAGSDTTPRRRGGFRGRAFGGGRWAKLKGTPHVTQVALDKAGTILANVVDDEVELPEDPEGEEKVDKNGYLQGGREYRVRTFPIEGKGDRLYMLSTEPARCIGFRDSYLFFQKHPALFKIILTEDAKKDLIERSLIPHSYKGRTIGVVTARSVFREFGAKIVIGGKKIMDDYQVKAARANGDVEGEYAVPEDSMPAAGDEYDRNRFVAWHGASAVYHTGGPSVPLASGKAVDNKKRKPVITSSNWMLEHARAASEFNSRLVTGRKELASGVYDVHTNIMMYPKNMQPTHCRWEQLPTPSPTASNSASPAPASQADDSNGQATQEWGPQLREGDRTFFPPVSAQVAQNFAVVDVVYESPASSTFPYPGPPGDLADGTPNGLDDIPEDIVDLLPDDCRKDFEEARDMERKWKNRWRGEGRDGMRGDPKIAYNM